MTAKQLGVPSFVYKFLLVDDRQEAEERARQLRGCGVIVDTYKSVNDVLSKVFGVTDVQESTFNDYAHDYDFVLLDYELEPQEDTGKTQLSHGLHPLGGLTLWPLFASSFRGRFGLCVIGAYSDKLDQENRLKMLKKLFEIGQSLQHGRDLRVAQTGFKDFNLAPLVEERAKSILLSLSRGCIQHILERAAEENSVNRILECEVPDLVIANNKTVTLGDLRPDIGRACFTKQAECDANVREITDDDLNNFTPWLISLQRDGSWLHSLHEFYHRSPEANGFCHNLLTDYPADFWRRHLIASGDGNFYASFPDERFAIPEDLYRVLSRLTWNSALERCSSGHSAFRLSLLDNASQRSLFGYAKGHFVSDLKVACESSYSDEAVVGAYVYIPKPILDDMLVSLAGQTGHTGSVNVAFNTARTHVQFVLNNGVPIDNDRLGAISKATWPVLAKIRQWGDLVAVDENGNCFVIGPGFFTGDSWGGGFTKEKNTFALRLAVHRTNESG